MNAFFFFVFPSFQQRLHPLQQEQEASSSRSPLSFLLSSALLTHLKANREWLTNLNPAHHRVKLQFFLKQSDCVVTHIRVMHVCSVSEFFSAVLPSESRGPLVEIKIGSSFKPIESTSTAPDALRSPSASHSRPAAAASAVQPKAPSYPSLPKDVALEKYSGLRLRSEHWSDDKLSVELGFLVLFLPIPVFLSLWLGSVCLLRKPRVSSSEMDRKMADRRLIRLSQLPERMAREKLEDSDWVTFAVLVNKATPQSNSSVSQTLWTLCSISDSFIEKYTKEVNKNSL